LGCLKLKCDFWVWQREIRPVCVDFRPDLSSSLFLCRRPECVGWSGLTDFRLDLISSLFLCRRSVYIVVDLLWLMLFLVFFVYCCRSALLLLFWMMWVLNICSEYLFIVVQRVKKIWVFLIFVHFVLVNWFELFAICCLCRVRLSKNVAHQRGRKPIGLRTERKRERLWNWKWGFRTERKREIFNSGLKWI
jgi:hypothetical protein